MDELEARAQRSLHRLRDLADDMATVRGRETSPNGAVTAVVDGNGALQELQFSSGIAELTPAEFETLVVETAGRAAQRAFTARAELVTAFNEENPDFDREGAR